MKKTNNFSKLLVIGVLCTFIFAACASTKVTSQAKTPNTVDSDSSVLIDEAK